MAYSARRAAALAPATPRGLTNSREVLLFLLATLPSAASDRLAEIRLRGAELESAHRWEEAADLYRSMLGQTDGGDSRFWLLTSLAQVEFERQDYAESERWLHQAAEIVEGLPAEALERVRLLNSLGTLHLVQGNLTEAERDLSRAVELGQSIAPPEDWAAALHNLAAVEMHWNRLGEASAHETQALAIWRERFGERHYYLKKAWISLSSLEGLRGDWQAAAKSLERALSISPSDEALSNYAIVLDKLKRHKEARAIRQRLHKPAVTPLPVVDVNALTRRDAPTVTSP
jgi:tetratricopeptide (TPR) repeat protein